METIKINDEGPEECPLDKDICWSCPYCQAINGDYAMCSYEDKIDYLEEKIIDDGEYKRKGYKDTY